MECFLSVLPIGQPWSDILPIKRSITEWFHFKRNTGVS